MQDCRIRTGFRESICPLDLKPEDIDIQDIARALSRICRFSSFTEKFYSVAQHCILCAEYLEEQGENRDIQLGGFTHDFCEGYSPSKDLPSPTKGYFSVFHIGESRQVDLKEYEDILNNTICKGLKVPDLTNHPKVKKADKVLFYTELRDIWGDYSNFGS